MSLGTRLYDLRRSKHLSQEDVADKLNVTRQTISKWETDQSTPDFDKIAPLCELYDITTEELLTGKQEEKVITPKDIKSDKESNSFPKSLTTLKCLAALPSNLSVNAANSTNKEALIKALMDLSALTWVDKIIATTPKDKFKSVKIFGIAFL